MSVAFSAITFARIRHLGGRLLFVCLIFYGSVGFAADKPQAGKTGQKSEKQTEKTAADKKWRALFDQKTLAGWKKTEFGSVAAVEMNDGVLQLEMGSPLSGVTIDPETFKTLPKINYEIVMEAKRVLGSDFFVGLTFPVKDASCTLVYGGWGGGVIGISNLDGYDAVENETTTYHTFKNNQWYKVRLQVTEKRIRSWLDDEQVIDVDIEHKRISTRIEVFLSEPLGLAAYDCESHLRGLKIRPLTTDEVKKLTEE